MGTLIEIKNTLENIKEDLAILKLDYKKKKKLDNILASDPALIHTLAEMNTVIQELYQQTIYLNGVEKEKIDTINTEFSNKKQNLDEKLMNYASEKNKKSASNIFKLDIYDRNIEDNLYIVYYFLSYGILGLFIYKILKQ
jgi:hypothetical protein